MWLKKYVWSKKRVYLDSASGFSGNPSSQHKEGRDAKLVLEDARRTIARLVEVQTDDVIFTSGATESNALVILGYVRALRAQGMKDMHVLYLPTAHSSIVENVKSLRDEGVDIEPMPVRDSRVDTDALKKMLRDTTVLVAMDAVCGETGVVWNTREVAEVLNSATLPQNMLKSDFNIVLHIDASQAPFTEKITRDHFGAGTLTFDASKVSSERGIGVLIAHRTIPLIPLYKGGGQERGLRSGTEAPSLAHCFALALSTAVTGRIMFREKASTQRECLKKLITNTIPNMYIQEGTKQAPNILNISLPGRDTDYLTALCDEDGFAVSTRSACETDSQSGSRAVFILTGDAERARSTLRVSWSSATSSHSLIRFARVLAREVAFIDNNKQR